MRRLLWALVMLVAVSVLAGNASAASAAERGFGGINRDPSGGIGSYIDPRLGIDGGHRNEVNPAYRPPQLPGDANVSPSRPPLSPYWVQGFWAWDGYQWVWVPEHWEWR